MKITGAIELFKAIESPESLLLVESDSDAISILVAWSKAYVKQHSKKKTITATDSHAQWQELWNMHSVDIEALSTATGLSVVSIPKTLLKLVNGQLLYPDGSISSYARNYLRSKIAKTIADNAPKAKRVSKK